MMAVLEKEKFLGGPDNSLSGPLSAAKRQEVRQSIAGIIKGAIKTRCRPLEPLVAARPRQASCLGHPRD
jgi:hypothetical protein